MLVVDAANVIGSRPTGWWRDRAGAARSLCDAVTAAVTAGHLDPPVVIVLEGAARGGVEPGGDAVRVVHAPGSGDDEVVAQVTAADGGVVVVTADRGLRSRVEALGATVTGPRWLHARVDPEGQADVRDG